MTATTVNHVSVHANDLDESAAFYEDLSGTRRIPAPDFAFPVQWLGLGTQQLHIIVRPGVQAPGFRHVALNAGDFAAVYRTARERTLHDESAFFSKTYELPGGAAQMYVRDPAGNLVAAGRP